MDYMAVEASEENYESMIGSTYVGTENMGIGICDNDDEGFSIYKAFIHSSSGWDKYDLFIFQENTYIWEGKFPARVTAIDGLNLRSFPMDGSSSTPLVVIPYETKIIVTDITKAFFGSSIWVKTTYDNQIGWCNASYLSFEFYSKVKNDIAYLYISPNEQEYLVQLKKGDEIIVKTDSGYNIPALQLSNDKIYCFTSVVDETGSTHSGYIRLDDLEFFLEEKIKEWTCYG